MKGLNKPTPEAKYRSEKKSKKKKYKRTINPSKFCSGSH